MRGDLRTCEASLPIGTLASRQDLRADVRPLQIAAYTIVFAGSVTGPSSDVEYV